MTKGEGLKVIVDYDLFDININGEVGVYLKTYPRSNKHLVHFPINGEYAELTDDQVERVNPGFATPENKEFSDRIQTLGLRVDS